MLAWSAYEALIRLLLGDRDGSMASARQTFEQAAFEGVISAEEQRRLSGLRQLRNAIIHGYNAPEFNDGSVRELIDIARGHLVATT